MPKAVTNLRTRMKVIKLSETQSAAVPASITSDSIEKLESLQKRPAIKKLAPAVPRVRSEVISSKNPAPLGHLLLKDLVNIFKAEKVPYIRTRYLIARLCSDPSKPWASFYRGSNITARHLSTLLKSYGISSCCLYYKEGNAKGFIKKEVSAAYRSHKSKLQKKSAQPAA